jgi:hypothetical protein
MEYGLERVLAGKPDSLPFLLAMHVRIHALGEQGARLVPRPTRLP